MEVEEREKEWQYGCNNSFIFCDEALKDHLKNQ